MRKNHGDAKPDKNAREKASGGFLRGNPERVKQRRIARADGPKNGERAGKDVVREVVDEYDCLPQAEQACEDDHAGDRREAALVHTWTTPRSNRVTCVTVSSNASDSRVSAVRGHARCTSTSCATRPGCAARMTMREERKTASATECVTNMTVHFCSLCKRSNSFVHAITRHLIERGEGSSISRTRGLVTERAGDRDPHLHAAGKLARVIARNLA